MAPIHKVHHLCCEPATNPAKANLNHVKPCNVQLTPSMLNRLDAFQMRGFRYILKIEQSSNRPFCILRSAYGSSAGVCARFHASQGGAGTQSQGTPTIMGIVCIAEVVDHFTTARMTKPQAWSEGPNSNTRFETPLEAFWMDLRHADLQSLQMTIVERPIGAMPANNIKHCRWIYEKETHDNYDPKNQAHDDFVKALALDRKF